MERLRTLAATRLDTHGLGICTMHFVCCTLRMLPPLYSRVKGRKGFGIGMSLGRFVHSLVLRPGK